MDAWVHLDFPAPPKLHADERIVSCRWWGSLPFPAHIQYAFFGCEPRTKGFYDWRCEPLKQPLITVLKDITFISARDLGMQTLLKRVSLALSSQIQPTVQHASHMYSAGHLDNE